MRSAGSPPPFQSLLEYTGGGGTIEETTRGPRSPEGWHLALAPERSVRGVVQKYRFDATGAWVATIKIYETEKVSRDAVPTSGTRRRIVSPTGVVQSTFTSTTHARGGYLARGVLPKLSRSAVS